MKNDDLLISKLINETCKEESTTEVSNVLNLSQYFEKRLNQVEHKSLKEYLIQHDVLHYKLEYMPFSKCYRLETENSLLLDFPSNWGPFTNITYSGCVQIDSQKNDNEFLCEILSEVVGEVNMLVITSENNSILLIPLSSSGLEHAQWLTEYFEKKNQKEAA